MDSTFFQHPVIQTIAGLPHWSVSDKDKRPIHMGKLLAGRFSGEGAVDGNPPYTASLNEIRAKLGIPNNAAFYLDSVETGIMVLDIEPDCPQDIKDKFLQTDWIYAETSLSGRGYHLLYHVPACLAKYPAAQKKVVLKCRKDYEFHMFHWVTFTGNQLSLQPGTVPIDDEFERLCAIQKESVKADVDVTDQDPGDFPMKDDIVHLLMSVDYRKTPDDFSRDMSRYEFGMAGFYASRLRNILRCAAVVGNGHTYTDQECIWMVYLVLLEKLAYRPKHDQYRNNLPWLLSEAADNWAQNK